MKITNNDELAQAYKSLESIKDTSNPTAAKKASEIVDAIEAYEKLNPAKPAKETKPVANVSDPAFPCTIPDGKFGAYPAPGMSRRFWAASIIAAQLWAVKTTDDAEETVASAYKIADELIKQEQK